MDPAAALLILLLSNDPAAKPEIDAIQTRLSQADATARVVIGPDALNLLKDRGASDGDLVADAQVGKALTRRDARLAVVRVEHRPVGNDVVIESRVWTGGEVDVHIAIHGHAPGSTTTAAEPERVAHGVMGILGRWMSEAQVAGTGSDAELVVLADRRDWPTILARTEAMRDPTARQLYYRILALVRSARPSEAEPVLQALAKAHPKHLLVDAAEALVHPVATSQAPAPVDINTTAGGPEDDGSNTLR